MGESLIPLANEAPAEQLQDLVSMANAAAFELDDSGWALLAPYGDHPHRRGIQRFRREHADEIVARFKSLAGRIKRAIVGLPIFRGHPDNLDFANQHTDKTRYGAVSDLQARDDGLYWRPVLTEDGAELVERGLKYPSINWGCRQLAANLFTPASCLSVGLTERPNLPSQSLANAKTDNPTQTNNTMPTWLLEMLGLGADATEDAVKAKLAELQQAAQAAAAQPAEAAAMANAKAALSKAQADLQQVQTDLANERKARREAVVADALKDGRIVEADKPVWLSRLERDFAGESVALANVAPSIKRPQDSRTGHLASRNAVSEDAADRTAQIAAAVAKRMKETGERHEVAFANCKRDPQLKTLFGAQ